MFKCSIQYLSAFEVGTIYFKVADFFLNHSHFKEFATSVTNNNELGTHYEYHWISASAVFHFGREASTGGQLPNLTSIARVFNIEMGWVVHHYNGIAENSLK